MIKLQNKHNLASSCLFRKEKEILKKHISFTVIATRVQACQLTVTHVDGRWSVGWGWYCRAFRWIAPGTLFNANCTLLLTLHRA